MKLIKNLLLLFAATILLASCGADLGLDNKDNSTTTGSNENTNNGDTSNNGNTGNDSEVIGPNNLNGSIWTGIYMSQYIGLKIKNDTELVFDQCIVEQKVIGYVKTEKGSNNFFRIFTYKKEGNKYKITGVKNGKDNPKGLKEFYFENNKLIVKDNNDQTVVSADLKESANDATDKKYILDEINKLRQAQGIAPVQDKNDGIKEAARIRAQEIEKLFEHKRPDGRVLDTILDEISVFKLYRPSKIGEIIAEYSTAKGAMEGWKKSEGHSKVLLDPDFTMASVGKNGRYWVVFFGKF